MSKKDKIKAVIKEFKDKLKNKPVGTFSPKKKKAKIKESKEDKKSVVGVGPKGGKFIVSSKGKSYIKKSVEDSIKQEIEAIIESQEKVEEFITKYKKEKNNE